MFQAAYLFWKHMMNNPSRIHVLQKLNITNPPTQSTPNMSDLSNQEARLAVLAWAERTKTLESQPKPLTHLAIQTILARHQQNYP